MLASTRSVAYPCDVRYLEFLGRVHELLTGPPYLEIGIRHGDSLALATGPAVGVDPEFELRVDLPRGVRLFEETSDEYFDRKHPLEPLGGRPVGYSFIDGMHLAEFALREMLAQLAPTVGFTYTVDVLNITVAALMTTEWIAKRIQVPPGTTKVMGWGDIEAAKKIVAESIERYQQKG